MIKTEEVRLQLGCCDRKMPGFVNVDIREDQNPDVVCDISHISTKFKDVDLIYSSHVLEHFSRRETFKVLENWVSKLKVGGVLKIAVPDFDKLARGYVASEEIDVEGYVCGGQVDPDDFHKAIFDDKGLTESFALLGLDDVKRWESNVTDCASYPISLNLQGTKTADDLLYGEIGFADQAYKPLLEGLSRKRRNVYSQNGEDGIVEAVFEKIGTQNKWCLEGGAADGILFSNTRRLVEAGWNAVLIEKDEEQYGKLLANCAKYPNVHCVNAEITASGVNSLDKILSRYNAPKEIDLVCIDIDGQDWHIWNQMIEYRPRVVMIEYDPNAEDDDFVPTIGAEGQAGKSAVQKLANSKLYHNTVITKYNIIAIRNDIKAIKNHVIKEPVPPDVEDHYESDVSKDEDVVGKPPSEPQLKEKNVKVFAVMSLPRLTFTDNMFSSVRSLIPLGINLEKGCGVFWGQVLTRLIEMHTNDGTDYIITVDYDTYFTKNQVIRLLQLMQENPEADAIIPLQNKRECDFPLIGRINKEKKAYTQIPNSEFEKELMPITTGHFGLTIFRVESLKKLKKPWFLPKPDPSGGWDDGRQDEDIYFWHNFAESGLQAFLAPRIGIVHLQLMATIPGRLQDGFKPQHVYLSDLEKDGLPEWCEPKAEMLK